jgi:hypothetical protein
VGGEAPVTPVSTLDSSFQTFPTNRAITKQVRNFKETTRKTSAQLKRNQEMKVKPPMGTSVQLKG